MAWAWVAMGERWSLLGSVNWAGWLFDSVYQRVCDCFKLEESLMDHCGTYILGSETW